MLTNRRGGVHHRGGAGVVGGGLGSVLGGGAIGNTAADSNILNAIDDDIIDERNLTTITINNDLSRIVEEDNDKITKNLRTISPKTIPYWRQVWGRCLIQGTLLMMHIKEYWRYGRCRAQSQRRVIHRERQSQMAIRNAIALVLALFVFMFVITKLFRKTEPYGDYFYDGSRNTGKTIPLSKITVLITSKRRKQEQEQQRKPRGSSSNSITTSTTTLFITLKKQHHHDENIVSEVVRKPTKPLDPHRFTYPNYGDIEFDEDEDEDDEDRNSNTTKIDDKKKEGRMGKPRRIIKSYRDVIGENAYNEEHKLTRVLASAYLAFDDDAKRRRKLHPRDDPNNRCLRNAWHKMYHPNCNTFHEMNMKYDKGDGYLDKGHYRRVFSYDDYDWIVKTASNSTVDSFILKSLRDSKHEFDAELFEMIRIDALVMERLTSSPRIVNIYGHCAFSVMTEDMYEELEYKIVPGSNDGYAKKEDIARWESRAAKKGDVAPRNNFTSTEKLDMALKMAEAVADLHGFKDGVIVHGDIQLCQFLRQHDHNVFKLNDFNRAEPMLFNTYSNEYCGYRNGGGYGNLRAPEEDRDDYLNEQLDVYSLGNNFYSLLTGLTVFYENEDDTVVQKYVKQGVMPFIDPRYLERSYAERQLIEITKQCWINDPKERVNIFQVVEFLRKSKIVNDRQLKRM